MKHRSHLPRGRRALVVVDVIESVRLMQANEADIIERWCEFVTSVRSELLPQCAGRLVKSLGDGLLLEFLEETQALAAARAMQRRIAGINTSRPDHERIELRVGVHVADVTIDTLDIYGAGVNLTARLASLGGPGQIVMSEDFHRSVEGRDPLDDLDDLGLCYLKHIETPVRAFRTRTGIKAAPAGAAAAAPRAAAEAGEPTVAVMGFLPAAGSPDDLVVAELLADAVTARLTRCPGLRVISRQSTRALQAGVASGAVAWSALRAHHLVSGRIYALGRRLMVSVEMIDTASERVTWAGRAGFGVEDLLQPDDDFTLQLASDIARQVAEARLRRACTAALPTLDGNQLQFTATSLMHEAAGDAVARAHVLLEHLIERFPRLPSPRAWAAMWHVLQVTRGIEHDPAKLADRAMDHVHRAMDNDPGCSLALAMQGFVHCHLQRDLASAEQVLSRAVEINPNEAWAWLFRSVVASHRGNAEDAWTWASQACALSPLDPLRHYFDALRATAAVAAERWEDAARLAQRSLAVNDKHLPTMRGLAIALVALGRIDEARQMGTRILAADPGFTLSEYLASAPPEGRETRQRYVESLSQAGLPMH